MLKGETNMSQEEILDEKYEMDSPDSGNETIAAKSIKAKGKVTDTQMADSKSSMMNGMMSAMAAMPKEQVANMFDQVMAQFGHWADNIPDDAAAKNAATIAAKPSAASGSMKEDVAEMFAGEELSEEFKEKATVLFEAAVNAKVTTVTQELEEQFEEALNEELSYFTEEVTDKLDNYLNYVVENWMVENEVAIESTLKNEINEEFIQGLKGLFEQNYIEMPEDKVDIVEELAEKVEHLENRLNDSINENAELKNVLSESVKKQVIDDVSSDLSLMQQDKFLSFAEGIEFDGDVDEYGKKLEIIKENYFGTQKQQVSSNLEEEVFEEETELNESYVHPSMQKYVNALQRTVKK